VLVRTAAHQRVAVVEPPDATGHAAVDEPDADRGEPTRVLGVVGPLGVAAVDDEVAGRQQAGELLDRRGDELDRHHDPHDARCREGLDELGERRDVAPAALVDVVSEDRVPRPAGALGHVRAHPAEPDHAEFHLAPSGGVLRTRYGWRTTPATASAS